MFHLHDKTRRQLCRAGFLLLCLAPSTLVAAWCIARHLPEHVAGESARLSRCLGMTVTLGGLRYPRPGVMLYEGLELADAETGQTVLRCRLVEVGTTDIVDDAGHTRSALLVTASQPEIDVAGWEQLRQLFGRLEQGQVAGPQVDVRLSAGEVTLRSEAGPQTLVDFEARVDSLAGGVQTEAAFRLAGAEAPEPIRLVIVRNRQTAPPSGRFELKTGDTATQDPAARVAELPAPLLALGLPDLAALGSRCRYRGYLWANQTPDGWEGEVTGRLADVDLGRLVSEHFPHKLSGVGDVTLRRARFRRGRLEEAAGELTLGPGVIGRSLLEAAVGRLGLTAGKAADGDADHLSYEQLAASFTIDANGLKLQGRCTAAGSGTILADHDAPLLGEPTQQPQPVVALIRTLVPQSALEVPATRQSDWLMRHLPVPQVIPTAEGPILPHAQLRLNSRQ